MTPYKVRRALRPPRPQDALLVALALLASAAVVCLAPLPYTETLRDHVTPLGVLAGTNATLGCGLLVLTMQQPNATVSVSVPGALAVWGFDLQSAAWPETTVQWEGENSSSWTGHVVMQNGGWSFCWFGLPFHATNQTEVPWANLTISEPATTNLLGWSY